MFCWPTSSLLTARFGCGRRIGGSLNCSGGQFSNPATRADPGAFAMSLVGMDITGSLLLNRGFRADGQVRINRSRIGGMFDGVGGEFHNPGGFCIFARAIRSVPGCCSAPGSWPRVRSG